MKKHRNLTESQNVIFAGVSHGDDILYIFPERIDYSDAQRLTADRLTKLWTNFATYQWVFCPRLSCCI